MNNVDLEAVRASVEIVQFCHTKIAELKELEKEHRSQIEAALGEGEIGQIDGETVVTWTHSKQNQLKQSKLKEDYPEIAAAYTELVERRTFKVVK